MPALPLGLAACFATYHGTGTRVSLARACRGCRILRVVTEREVKRRICAEGELAMTETKQEVDVAVQPCARCGWMRFNPDCPVCQEMLEECLLLGRGVDGVDM